VNTGIPETVLEKLRHVFRGHKEVLEAILYGSRAKGTHHSGLDIDIVLSGKEDLDFGVLIRVMTDVEELLLPYTVDLAILGNLRKPALLDHISRVGVRVYRR